MKTKPEIRLKIRLLIAFAAILLCACSRQNTDNIPSPIISPDESGEQSDGAQGTEPPDTSSQDDEPSHDGMARSRLTNEWVAEGTAQTRPIAVIIPNEVNALPQYNLSEASVLYEANVEGRMTRLMGIFEGWTDLNPIGNIRSLRTYFAYWSFEWDAILVHSGGPYYIDNLLLEPTTQNVNDHQGTDTDAFYRDGSRSVPHNLYATGQGILGVVSKKGYSLTYRDLTDREHYRFADDSNPNTLTQYGKTPKARFTLTCRVAILSQGAILNTMNPMGFTTAASTCWAERTVPIWTPPPDSSFPLRTFLYRTSPMRSWTTTGTWPSPVMTTPWTAGFSQTAEGFM